MMVTGICGTPCIPLFLFIPRSVNLFTKQPTQDMRFPTTCIAAVAVLVLAQTAVAEAHPGVNNCTLKWKSQYVDHFTWSKGQYQQRYFVYDKWFEPGGPIFFYNGNEANVELFANWTGLMWENGQQMKALLVFAEHRFFGKSLPCPGGYLECGQYLGTEQAMADYAALVVDLKEQYPGSSATVAFGGS